MKSNSTPMKSNLTPIASAVAVLLMSASFAAQAQETAAPAAPKVVAAAEPAVQEVRVVGIRASLQQSLNQKRNSDSNIEVITAEDVGKMPDKNVADSLQRLPGVNVAAAGGGEGSFGENDRVALRGTPFALTLTTLNGHSVSSGDWFADNIVGGGRSVSYSLFPSELIGRVTVHKGSQADLLEGGAEGVVDIETRKPLDFKKSFNGQVSIGAVNSSNSGKTDPQFNGLVAWKNDTSTLGVLAQAFYEKRTLSRVGQENQIWWDKVDAGGPIDLGVPGAGTANTATTPASGALTSFLGGTAWFEQKRTRKGGLLDVQAKLSNDFSLDLTAFHSHMDAPNINHNFMQSLGRMLGPSWAVAGFPTGNITGTLNNGVITQLTAKVPVGACAPCSSMSSAVQEEFDRPVAESQSQFVNVDMKFRVSDKLSLSGKIGSTKGIGNTVSGAIGIWMPWTGGSYQINGLDQPVTYVTPGANTFSLVSTGGNSVPYTYGSHVSSIDKEDYIQMDGVYKTSLASLTTVKFGARAARHERDLSSIGINALPGLSDPANLPMSGLVGFPSKFSDLGAGAMGAGYWTFNQESVSAWLAKYAYYSGHLKQNEFAIKEPTESAYLMGEFSAEGMSGNFGARVAHTTEDVLRYEIGPSGTFEPKKYGASYMDFLPSANIKLDLSKDLVARFGVSRTMARPELGQMAGIDLRDVQGTGTVGNPNLRPIRANTGDMGVEWYFAPKSMLSADVFYSALDGYVTYGSSSGTYYNQLAKANTVYQTSTPLNTTAEVKGLELGYVQSLAGGFGINTNYTYTIGAETGHAPGSTCGALVAPDCTMIGTSKNAYNVGGYFENDKFSARLTYSYRSGFLNGTSRNSAAFQAPIGTLSATVAYQITDNFSVTMDGKDLNDPLVRSIIHTRGADDVPGALYKNGRQIYVAFHAKM